MVSLLGYCGIIFLFNVTKPMFCSIQQGRRSVASLQEKDKEHVERGLRTHCHLVPGLIGTAIVTDMTDMVPVVRLSDVQGVHYIDGTENCFQDRVTIGKSIEEVIEVTPLNVQTVRNFQLRIETVCCSYGIV